MENTNELMNWLESAVKHVITTQDDDCSVILCTLSKDSVDTIYYNCGVAEKILAAGYIQQDSMMDTIATTFSNLHMNTEDPSTTEDDYPEIEDG